MKNENRLIKNGKKKGIFGNDRMNYLIDFNLYIDSVLLVSILKMFLKNDVRRR